ncbi:SOS response-associated peptidase [Kineococcus rhizosphaerae]|uniref:Abasic site processing protein n=1 Tax=Kineococcus rhizosphaerae TaxID=559628 RepID=A0A2T0R416_9ACTN|nr:SOS response-associated peptidase [Kineococcus rhizosphaerae]PRY15093.1 putative SOS response-associated peptidase YedK [Kineococcus rhizosphaerae]
MCGRYALRRELDDLVEEFEVDDNTIGADDAVTRSTNVAPTTTPPVVLERFRKDEPDAPPTRSLRALRWGLVPSWSKDASGAARMVNARVESLLSKPAFAKAALARRCLVPVDAWYEWQTSPSATEGGKPRKQPFAVAAADGSVLSLAGVYEFWKDESKAPEDPSRWLVSFAVVTTAAEPGLDRLHERMPLVVPRDLRDPWLDPSLDDADDVSSLLQAVPRDLFAGGALEAHPVSRAVGNVRNHGADLLDPVPPADLEGVVDLRTGELLGA